MNTSTNEDLEDESWVGEHEKDENKEEEKFVLAKDENQAVWCLRVIVLLLLVGVALGICLSVYIVFRRSEVDDFEQDFRDLAYQIVGTIELNLKRRYGIVGNFGKQVTYAVKHDPNMTWPFLTLPATDFQNLAETSAVLADIFVLSIVPRVETKEKDAWIAYIKKKRSWFPEVMALQNGISLGEAEAQAKPIPAAILNIGPDGPFQVSKEPGPYFPVWQSYPVSNEATWGLNLYAHPHYHDALNVVMTEQRPVTTASYDFLDPVKAAVDPRKPMIDSYLTTYEKHGAKYENDPLMPGFYPIFNDFNTERKSVVGVIIFGVYWKTFFRQLVPAGATGILVVLENTCQQQYTYQIDGTEAKFLSYGDVHDSKYNHLEASGNVRSMMMQSFAEGQDYADFSPVAEGDCQYRFRVYPSQAYEDLHTTRKPLIFTFILAAMFIITSSAFVLYDRCVARRQKIVAKSAEQSGAIVQSLFPESVRDRLYEEKNIEALSRSGFKEDIHSDAIAHNHPDCTILFSDIVGFTQWGSWRQPTEVFDLLETLYGAFDTLTHKWGVFKVETIGDCYVAATGLPTPQTNHAVRMTRFAHDCVKALAELLQDSGDLVGRLGKDTSKLSMRFGLHSGPVTAGILRGEKSRFQIFGDTVNTAARMESSGRPGRIHVTETTARILIKAGKESWVTARDTLVSAKGKGDMQTYWVQIVERAPLSVTTSSWTGQTVSDEIGSTP